MYNVRQVLNAKGQEVWTATPQTSAPEAIRLMAEKKVGALVICEGDELAGIVSERDVITMIASTGEFSPTKPIKEYMTRALYTISPGDSMEKCMVLMSQKNIRHLPVLEDGKLIGIISIRDVVKEVIENREETIHNLEDYIQGTGYKR